MSMQVARDIVPDEIKYLKHSHAKPLCPSNYPEKYPPVALGKRRANSQLEEGYTTTDAKKLPQGLSSSNMCLNSIGDTNHALQRGFVVAMLFMTRHSL